jgi:phosphatidylinositol-bisphosphatase
MIIEIYSWNVNTNQKISKELIKKLLASNTKSDFIIISLQESKSQFSLRDNLQEWVDLLVGNYSLVKCIKINGIGLIVIKKSDALINNLKVKYGTLGCGLLGLYGNKGAVAIGLEFSLDGSKFCSVCFVGMHLDPHVDRFNERNKSAQFLFNTLLLQGERDSTSLIHDYDVVFVAGDLNYRFLTTEKDVGSKERKEIDEMIDSGDIKGLREKDELKLKTGPWDSWNEGEITFLPTYKYNLKTINQSKVSAQFSKSRNPGYTDRILFKSLKSDVNVLMYNSIPGLQFSDHQPVYGRFLVGFDSPTEPRQGMSSRDLVFRSTWYKIIRILEINWVLWLFVLFYLFYRYLFL